MWLRLQNPFLRKRLGFLHRGIDKGYIRSWMLKFLKKHKKIVSHFRVIRCSMIQWSSTFFIFFWYLFCNFNYLTQISTIYMKWHLFCKSSLPTQKPKNSSSTWKYKSLHFLHWSKRCRSTCAKLSMVGWCSSSLFLTSDRDQKNHGRQLQHIVWYFKLLVLFSFFFKPNTFLMKRTNNRCSLPTYFFPPKSSFCLQSW